MTDPQRLHPPIEVRSKPTLVRLYEDRAEVVRRAAVEVAPGQQWVALAGVSAVLDDRTVMADVKADGVRVVSARVIRRAVLAEEARAVDALEAKAEGLADELAGAQRTEERARTQLGRSGHALQGWLDGLEKGAELAADETKKAWLAAYRSIREAEARALKAMQTGRHEQAEVRETAAALYEKLSAKRSEAPEIEAVIEVQLASSRTGPVELEVRYRTPCAVWRPEHHAALRFESGGDPEIELTTHATVWQATGEDWSDVQAEFSTARPAQVASAPLLDEDRIVSRKKTDEERQKIVVEAREQEVQVAGLSDGARRVEEMPGMDDGGEPLLYRATEAVTLPSTGRPYRVEIARAQLPAKVGRILVSEQTPVAHWRATATLTTDGPLLAGPVRISLNGNAMGRSKVDFVGKGEPFEMGFGQDDGLRVRRKRTEKRDRTPVIGTQKIDRSVRLYVSNLSGEVKEVTLIERIPVSEIDEVEISLTDGGQDWTHNSRDGFLRRKIMLGAKETKAVRYGYEIRAKSNVTLPF